MRILVTAVFEQVVYHCACIDERDPAHPRLEVDAILRDGDADGPLDRFRAGLGRARSVHLRRVACTPIPTRDRHRTARLIYDECAAMRRVQARSVDAGKPMLRVTSTRTRLPCFVRSLQEFASRFRAPR